MTFDIERFGGEGTVKSLRIHLRGHFCFKEGLDLWQTVHPRKQLCQIYYVDMAGVDDLTEDGVAWIRMFLRWAEGTGVSVRIIDASPAHLALLGEAGISENGTAIDHDGPSFRKGHGTQRSPSTEDIGEVTLEQIALLSHRDESVVTNLIERIREAS